jgi:hypothetical protein
MAQLTTRQHRIDTLAFLRADGTPGEITAGSVVVTASDAAVMTAALLADGTVDVVAVAVGTGATYTVTAGTASGDISGAPPEATDVVVDPRDAVATTVAVTLGTPADR